MAASDISDRDGRLGTMTEPDAAPSPENDEELGGAMTLVEHLEELRRRLLIALVAIAICSALAFVFWTRILDFLLLPLPAAATGVQHELHVPSNELVVHSLGEPFMMALKLAIAVGIVVASPVVLYQVWGFIAPALTRREHKYALPFTLLGLGLFVIGLAVGFVVLRYPVNWLVQFGNGHFLLLLDADSYFTFVAYFLLAFGVVFELPLVVTFLGILGIVSSQVLREKRLVILFGLWVLSCFITPGADPYSPVIIGVSFTVLFELSVVLLRVLKK